MTLADYTVRVFCYSNIARRQRGWLNMNNKLFLELLEETDRLAKKTHDETIANGDVAEAIIDELRVYKLRNEMLIEVLKHAIEKELNI